LPPSYLYLFVKISQGFTNIIIFGKDLVDLLLTFTDLVFFLAL